MTPLPELLTHVFVNIDRIEKNFNQNHERFCILDRRRESRAVKTARFSPRGAVLSKDEPAAGLRNLTHLLMYIALIEKNFNHSHKKNCIIDRRCESDAIAAGQDGPSDVGCSRPRRSRMVTSTTMMQACTISSTASAGPAFRSISALTPMHMLIR